MNYYEVLGISETASDKEIKKAYKSLVKKYHPDVFNGNKEFAETRIKEINEAYDVLSNPSLKQEYDDSLHSVSSSSDFSFDNDFYKENNDLYKRYENFYNSDFSRYKHYTTNYYGISRDDLNKQKDQKNSNPFYINKIKTNSLIILVLFLFLMFIILMILLSSFQSLLNTTNSPLGDFLSTSENSSTIDNSVSYSYQEYIYLNMTYKDVKRILGSPSYTEEKDSYTYAYWGKSYIVFDENDLVIDWQNNGDFYSETQTGSEYRQIEEFYNYIQNSIDNYNDEFYYMEQNSVNTI